MSYHQTVMRDSSGVQVVEAITPGSGVNPGTVGTAFHILICSALSPMEVPALAKRGIAWDPDADRLLPLLDRASDILRGSVQRDGSLNESVARAAWALALCEEAYRIGGVWPGGSLDDFLDRDDELSLDGLLELAPQGGVEQLVCLHDLAQDALYSHLPGSPSQLELGPTFEASKLCSADADVICDGLLLEVKTTSGRARRNTSVRRDTLSRQAVYQLLSYLLFDTRDRYRIRNLGWYSARFGSLVIFEVDEFLSNLAGGYVNLRKERVVIESLLRSA